MALADGTLKRLVVARWRRKKQGEHHVEIADQGFAAVEYFQLEVGGGAAGLLPDEEPAHLRRRSIFTTVSAAVASHSARFFSR